MFWKRKVKLREIVVGNWKVNLRRICFVGGIYWKR